MAAAAVARRSAAGGALAFSALIHGASATARGRGRRAVRRAGPRGTDQRDPFGRYYAEILRAEGLNGFTVGDLAEVGPGRAQHEAVLLAARDVSDAQVAMLDEWAHAGGQPRRDAPDAALGALLGLGTDAGDPRRGLRRCRHRRPRDHRDTMQLHGSADRWTGGTARPSPAVLERHDATAAPAVTLRSVGSAGGQAAAFTYDLARSVVYTRQGNPAWAGRSASRVDGADPLRRPLLPTGST